MPKHVALTAAQREKLTLVDQAAFANPFSPERDAIDARIVDSGSPTATLEELRIAVGRIVADLERRDHARIDRFQGDDRKLVSSVLLFDSFHRFLDPLDELIADQVRTGNESRRVPFARDLLALLSSRGFSPTDALRYLAVFYQLRRAFYFIERRITGASPCLRALRMQLWNNVFTLDAARYDRWMWNRMENFSTLLVGETGSGKGTAAVAIGCSGFIPYEERSGRFSESFTRAFVAINLSQYAEALIESELFGHKKGSFTGAVADHRGIFARCSPHGSIFLDEIGELSIPVQIKLLKVLEERAFSPVGSHDLERFPGRVIAATNQPLDTLRRDGRFRDDLYYRLCSDVLRIPPLRQRIEEDPEELDRLLVHVVRDTIGEESPEITQAVRESLQRDPGPGYAWPGNVRELQQCVRRILLCGRYADGETPSPAAHGARSPSGTPTFRTQAEQFLDSVARGGLDADALLSGYASLLHQKLGSYRAVAVRLGIDQRTARRHVLAASPIPQPENLLGMAAKKRKKQQT